MSRFLAVAILSALIGAQPVLAVNFVVDPSANGFDTPQAIALKAIGFGASRTPSAPSLTQALADYAVMTNQPGETDLAQHIGIKNDFGRRSVN